MKISIRLEYKSKVYVSDESEASEEELKQVNEMIEKVAGGKVEHFSFKDGNEEYYFSKKILEESVITIINAT